jgi:hypothetical protein
MLVRAGGGGERNINELNENKTKELYGNIFVLITTMNHLETILIFI